MLQMYCKVCQKSIHLKKYIFSIRKYATTELICYKSLIPLNVEVQLTILDHSVFSACDGLPIGHVLLLTNFI